MSNRHTWMIEWNNPVFKNIWSTFRTFATRREARKQKAIFRGNGNNYRVVKYVPAETLKKAGVK